MRIQLSDLPRLKRQNTPRGMTSVCSAHPIVLRAALRHGRDTRSTVLIEATCNQVNHQGGYPGMQPADFAAMVQRLATEEGCTPDLIVLGGDHLGPDPWRDLPADQALAEAEQMIAACVAAGFRKIHLDASMGCKGEPVALDDEITARRAAQPGRWQHPYGGSESEQRLPRHYSLSDRIRYCWPEPEAKAAVGRLMAVLTGVRVPLLLFWQHMPGGAHLANPPLDPTEVLVWRIRESLAGYHAACGFDR
jgi:tagatose-1,6-bisphosphate aldolase non-catalytic subunit AgaZ/GatZ